MEVYGIYEIRYIYIYRQMNTLASHIRVGGWCITSERKVTLVTSMLIYCLTGLSMSGKVILYPHPYHPLLPYEGLVQPDYLYCMRRWIPCFFVFIPCKVLDDQLILLSQGIYNNKYIEDPLCSFFILMQ